jgi:hypothetical protein
MNLQLFVSTSMKPWKWVHSTFQVFSWCLDHVCQKDEWIFVNVCWLSWTKSIHHRESISFIVNLRIVGPSKSCQNVYQDWFMWSIQLKAYLKRWQMKYNI